jgi:hypothetical protein
LFLSFVDYPVAIFHEDFSLELMQSLQVRLSFLRGSYFCPILIFFSL